MALSPKLELKQSQSLVMTPQLMQAIKLLQLGNLDLIAYVDAELERNPLLERDEAEERPVAAEANGADTAERAEAEPADSSDREDFSGDSNGSDWGDQSFATATEISEKLDTDLSNLYQDDRPEPTERLLDPGQLVGDAWAHAGSRGGSGSDEDYNLEAFVAADVSLGDHLAEQLALAVTDPVCRLIGQYLIDAVDDAGYLRTDLLSVAEKLGCPLQLVEEVLAELQAAVGMRDGHRTLDVVGHRLAGRIGEIIQRENDDMIAHAHASVLATISLKFFLHGYHLLVLRL